MEKKLCHFEQCSALTNLSLDFCNPQLSLTNMGIILNENDCFEFFKQNFNSQFFPNLNSIEISAVEKAESKEVYVAQELNGFHGKLTTLHIRNSDCLRLDALNLYKFLNITSLTFTKCGITILPASVGKLENLKDLVLSKNKLSTLPYFIVYCKQLEFLDLSGNCFKFLPGYLQELQNIKTLRRLDNPLVDFVKASNLDSVQISKSKNENENECEVPPLQTLCLPVIIRCYPNYWDLDIAPTLCRMLDNNAENIVYCEKCYKPGFKPDFFVLHSILFRCYGLNLVPFGHYSCSNLCNRKIIDYVNRRSRRIREKWEQEYNHMVDRHKVEFERSMLPRVADSENNTRKCCVL